MMFFPKTLAIVLICLTAFHACNKSPKPPPQPTPTTPTPSPQPSATPTAMPCADNSDDVTPAILNAIAKGESHSGGGCIRGQLIVEGDLSLGPGVYQIVQPILIKSKSSITGAGWDTIILESTLEGQFTVFSAYNNSRRNGDGDSVITLRNFKIAGANPGFNSAPQAVSLGNCVDCIVDNLWLDRTRSIGIQLGGSAQFGNHAEHSKITNCLLTHVASQALALVNGVDIEISGNRILKPGQLGGPGASSIDLEVNGADDKLVNVKITGNVIDHQDAEVETTGNGIIVNSGEARADNILIDSNTIIGGHRDVPVTNVLSNGIYVFGSSLTNVVITRNRITRTGQSGIRLEDSGFICEDNILDSVGGGGTAGFVVIGNNSSVKRNSLVCSIGPCDNRMQVSGDGNIFEGNSGWVVTKL